MSEVFLGVLDGKDTATETKVRIRLDADSGDARIGGNGRDGDVLVRDESDVTRIRLRVGTEAAVSLPQLDKPRIVLNGLSGSLTLGDHEADGRLLVKNSAGKTVIDLRTSAGGAIVVRDASGKELMTLDGSAVAGTAGLRVGAFASEGGGKSGWIAVRDQAGSDVVVLDGASQRIELRDSDGRVVFLVEGEASGPSTGLMVGTFEADGGKHPGWIAVRDHNGNDTVFLDGETGRVRCGASGTLSFLSTVEVNGTDGSILLRAPVQEEGGVVADTADRIFLRPAGASIWLGGNGQAGDLVVLPDTATAFDTAQASVWVKGSDGDIILRNADCAEEFDVAPGAHVEGGDVMVIDQTGRLLPSVHPYDHSVAGIVSGAGDSRPGLILGRLPDRTDRVPIALAGRVHCKVDAAESPIRVGDLLTTSSRPGHAMKVTRRRRAVGAIVAKALASHAAGCGQIPVLVALQ